MKTFLQGIWAVTRHELADAASSRRAVVLLVLFTGAAMLGCNIFISILSRVESQLAESLGVQAVSATGRIAGTLWESEPFRKMMMSLAGDADIARRLLAYPPVALVFGWLVFMYTPLLVLLMAAPRIAADVSSGAARYILFRTGRAPWVLGKFCGQALLVMLALFFSIIGAWCIIRFRVPGSGSFTVLPPMIVFAAMAWFYALPYAGLALCVSQLTRSPHLATAMAFTGLFMLNIGNWALARFSGPGWRHILEVPAQLLPQAYRLELWRGAGYQLFYALFFLVVLALAYLLAGYFVLARKDL